VAAITDSHETVGLRANAVSLWGDFVISIANVAPSSSVAFTLALLVGFTSYSAPLAVLVVGIAMFLVSMGYAALNRWKPSAGAPYVWVGEAITPTVGYGTGFLNVLTSTLANVGNITLAGTYLLFVITPTHTFAKPVTWLVATAIMGVLLWLAIRGIRPTVWVQVGFIVIEYGAVISFVILALIHEASGAGGARLPAWSDFTIAQVVNGVGGFKGLAQAAVVCGFLYLGWEATSVLGEESKKPKVNVGRAMMLGTGFLTVWYTFLIIVFQGVSSQKDVLAHGTDILAYAGTLPDLPVELQQARDTMEQVDECAIPVFLSAQLHEGTVHYAIDVPRDAPTMRGFAALLHAGLHGATPAAIAATPDDLCQQLGLQQALGALRVRGLTALLMRMKRNAHDLAS